MASLADLEKCRTGMSLHCRCKPQPYPFDLEGETARTANDAAVLRDAFRKHNHAIRTKSLYDDGSWDLPLSKESPRPVLPDRINRLPTEILDQILSDVFNSTETSNDICTCSRPGTPYKIVKSRSLVHRVVDTFAIRLTCYRWRSWALKSALSGAAAGEHIELDISNLSTFCSKMKIPVGGIAKRLARDFPFLTWSGITLYLGNPGEVSNLMLAAEMLIQEKALGGGDYRIFRGVSFWDLDYIVRENAPQAPWNVGALMILDIFSHFSAMGVATRVQFPTTIFAMLPRSYWAPVLEGLISFSDRLSLREFLAIGVAPSSRRHRARNRNNRNSVPNLPSVPRGNLLDLREHFRRIQFGKHGVPADLDRYCGKLHSAAFLGPEKHWRHLRHLNLNLESHPTDTTQNWGIDDAFLAKLSRCNLDKLISVQIDGGLASRLTIDGLLQFLRPSYGTLQKLIFRPAVADPGTRGHDGEGMRHHCDVLSSLSLEKMFPRLEELELHIPCCPDIFRPDFHQSRVSALKRHWKIVIQRKEDAFLWFCQDWVTRQMGPWLSLHFPSETLRWNERSLGFIFGAARVARKSLLSREVQQAEEMQSELKEIAPKTHEMWLAKESIEKAKELSMEQDQAAQIEDMKILSHKLEGMKIALANKWREVSEKWELEIHMENVEINGRFFLDKCACSS